MARRPAARSTIRATIRYIWILGLVAVALPKSAAAEPTDPKALGPDPYDAHPPSSGLALDEYPPPSARRNLLLVGLGSTAVWYGGALAASYAAPDAAGAKDLRIPLAGPWMSLSHAGCDGGPDCNTLLVVLGAIATTLDGIGQAAGLLLAAEGLFMPTQEPKRKRASLPHQGFELRPSFDAGKNTVSFGVLGVF
jgi:hypothetical protein